MLKRHPRIDALFVSHLHEDHVSGLNRHLRNIHPNTVFIPHLSVAAKVAALVADAADGAPSDSLVQASLEPEDWFGQRGVSSIVRVLPSLPGEAPTADPRPEDSPEGEEPPYTVLRTLQEVSQVAAVEPDSIVSSPTHDHSNRSEPNNAGRTMAGQASGRWSWPSEDRREIISRPYPTSAADQASSLRSAAPYMANRLLGGKRPGQRSRITAASRGVGNSWDFRRWPEVPMFGP